MNKKKHGRAGQGGTCTNPNKPIIFELAAIAGLFFNEEGIQELFEHDMLHLAEVRTIDNERADIIVGLSIATSDYFELSFVLTTTRGIERFSIYDEIENLESFHLKRWMHIVLCDEGRKSSLINSFPEDYSFDSNLFLA
ncbi:MAG: hypothetical protein JWR05_2295 [Mucilaginibacter sp.]|nr:hypothetical protein [Mucilaginibacter sp.]